MIEFLNEDVRTAFHCLSVDRQREIQGQADREAAFGRKLTVLYVELTDSGELEISIRIDKQSNVIAVDP